VIAPAAAVLATKLPSAGVMAAGVLAAAVVVAGLVLLMRRREDAFPLLAIFALPFRLPISTGGKTVNLLIPLYLVVAAGTITYLLPLLEWRAQRHGGGSGAGRAAEAAAAGSAEGAQPGGAEAPPPGRLAAWLTPDGVQRLLLGAVALYVLQSLYSADHTKAAENIAFFYVPFALLFLVLRRVRWTHELLLRCLALAAALAVAFAGVGFVEYARKSLFLNPKVVAANQYDNYFRVNSLFFDPNIYGRFLALVMIAVTTVVLWTRRRRDMLIGAAVLAWLLGGLVTSFSQSSIAALLLGLAVLAAYRWDVRATLYTAVGLLALGGALVLLAPASLHFGLKGSGGSTSNATSGRTKLISGGLELFAERPLQGYGPGSFEREYKRHSGASAQNATSASHTIPVTVAAEQGIPGLAVYAALLLAAFAVLFRRAGRSPPRIAIAACFAALVLHTWTYADFLEDPFTWALLAIGLALADAARDARASSF
jgi:O-antigen ligase